MKTVFCPACGIDVKVVVMTLGMGVAAEEKEKCEHCGFDLTEASAATAGVHFARVGIAEDMSRIRAAVRDDLLEHQMATTVDEFPDGGAFVKAVQTLTASGGSYDLVILDLNMPMVNGLKSAAFLRATEKRLGLPAAPILIFSSVVCDERLMKQIEGLAPALYLNKATIQARDNLPGRLRSVLSALQQS